jgi:hypothetical protein
LVATVARGAAPARCVATYCDYGEGNLVLVIILDLLQVDRGIRLDDGRSKQQHCLRNTHIASDG